MAAGASVPLAVGAVAAALLAAVAVLGRSRRARCLGMAGALVLAPILLIAHIWEAPQFRPFRDRPLLALAGVAVVLALVVAAGVLLARRPSILPVAVVALLPFRLPIESGGTSSNLLVPLYLVVAAGVVGEIVAWRRGDREEGQDRPAGAVEWLLMGLVVAYAVQSLYSVGFGKALENLVFFYVPFSLVFALLVRIEWTPRLIRTCLGVLLALALVFCAIGFVEYQRRTLLLNPQVIASNQFQSYFRVNSLFFDPNIFGRFLVVVMLGVVVAMITTPRSRTAALAAAALVVLFAGLVLTLSQSSLGALLVGLAVVAALRWSLGWTVAAAVAAIAVAVAVVVLFPAALRVHLNNQESIESATSGRGQLVAGGGRLFADRPVAGWGSGSFEPQFRRRERVSSLRAATASHTIPITVAAEQGVIGLALYLALLVAAFGRLLRGARASPARAAIAAAFTALVLHTFLYAAFLEDPLAWVLLAAGSALAIRARPAPERHPAENLAIA